MGMVCFLRVAPTAHLAGETWGAGPPIARYGWVRCYLLSSRCIQHDLAEKIQSRWGVDLLSVAVYLKENAPRCVEGVSRRG